MIIPIPTVSTRHAQIRVAEDGRVTITDLGSRNGTTVNKSELQPLEAVELTAGSEVVFGDPFLARFRLDAVGGSGAGRAARVLEAT